MKRFRLIIALVCIAASLVADAGEQRAANAACSAPRSTAGDLQTLQGTWEGVLVGDQLRKKITLTIAGDSLHFHRDRNFWFETTIALPAGKDPKQLHATIRNRAPSQPVSIGQVIRAFFKLEDGTLTLATIPDEAEETSKSFEAAGTRYEFRKIQPDTK